MENSSDILDIDWHGICYSELQTRRRMRKLVISRGEVASSA